MIAYDHTAPLCQACPSHVDCQARVGTLRPKVIALLDRFSDASGREMSHAWLTKGERKARKKALVDDSLVTMNLQPPDARSSTSLTRAARNSVDPRTCTIADLHVVSKHAGRIASLIQQAPATREAITCHLQETGGLSDASARRIATREVSFLISAGRARFAGPHLELV
jgi:hypothetical protein